MNREKERGKETKEEQKSLLEPACFHLLKAEPEGLQAGGAGSECWGKPRAPCALSSGPRALTNPPKQPLESKPWSPNLLGFAGILYKTADVRTCTILNLVSIYFSPLYVILGVPELEI